MSDHYLVVCVVPEKTELQFICVCNLAMQIVWHVLEFWYTAHHFEAVSGMETFCLEHVYNMLRVFVTCVLTLITYPEYNLLMRKFVRWFWVVWYKRFTKKHLIFNNLLMCICKVMFGSHKVPNLHSLSIVQLVQKWKWVIQHYGNLHKYWRNNW